MTALSRIPSHLDIRLEVSPAWTGKDADGVSLARPGKDADGVLGSDLAPCIRTARLTLFSTPAASATSDSVVPLIGLLPALTHLKIRVLDNAFADGIAALRGLVNACRDKRIRISIDLVLNANADVFAMFGGEQGSMTRVRDLSRELSDELGLNVRWLVPAIPALAHRLEAIFSFAADKGIDPVLVPQWVLAGSGGVVQPALETEERVFIKDFIAYRLLAPNTELARGQQMFYRQLLASVEDPEAGVWPKKTVAVLNGGIHGSQVQWAVASESRPTLDGMWHSGGRVGSVVPAWTRKAAALAADLSEVGTEGIRALMRWLVPSLGAGLLNPGAPVGPKLRHVLVIGAYGGDHIGDTAIFGGVLLRMHRRYGTQSAVLVSQRPAHTRRLVEMLDSPVDISVEEYTQTNARILLEHTHAVVFAGGPLMDLPKQLVKHLYTVAEARRRA